MLNVQTAAATLPPVARTAQSAAARTAVRIGWTDEAENQRIAQSITETLRLVQDQLAPQRRVVHAGDTVYQAGQRFSHLHILNSGMVKVVNLSNDGREQVGAEDEGAFTHTVPPLTRMI